MNKYKSLESVLNMDLNFLQFENFWKSALWMFLFLLVICYYTPILLITEEKPTVLWFSTQNYIESSVQFLWYNIRWWDQQFSRQNKAEKSLSNNWTSFVNLWGKFTGSVFERGAIYALFSLSPEQKSKGVVSASPGMLIINSHVISSKLGLLMPLMA